MSVTEFMQMLDDAESSVHARMEQARHTLAELEAEAAHLAITRETAVALAARAQAATASPKPVPAADKVVPTRDHTPAPDPDAQTAPHSGAQSLGPVSDSVMSLLASSDRAWRAREVAVALGNPNPTRDQTAGIRNFLLRLTGLGYVERTAPGLYAAAQNMEEDPTR